MKKLKKLLTALLMAIVCVGCMQHITSAMTGGTEAMGKELLEKNSNLFNYIDRKNFEDKDYVGRLTELEQLNTYVFRKSDGSNEIYYLDENVKFVRDGIINEIDLSVIANETGFTVANHDINYSFPKSIDEGVSLEYLGKVLNLSQLKLIKQRRRIMALMLLMLQCLAHIQH